MIKIWIYGPALPKDGFAEKARDEYLKRLSRTASVRFKPLTAAPQGALCFCPKGDTIDSPGLAALFLEQLHLGSELHLVLAPSCLKTAGRHLQLTSITLSPATESVLLLEQVYRAFKILSGEPYHK